MTTNRTKNNICYNLSREYIACSTPPPAHPAGEGGPLEAPAAAIFFWHLHYFPYKKMCNLAFRAFFQCFALVWGVIIVYRIFWLVSPTNHYETPHVWSHIFWSDFAKPISIYRVGQYSIMYCSQRALYTSHSTTKLCPQAACPHQLQDGVFRQEEHRAVRQGPHARFHRGSFPLIPKKNLVAAEVALLYGVEAYLPVRSLFLSSCLWNKISMISYNGDRLVNNNTKHVIYHCVRS